MKDQEREQRKSEETDNAEVKESSQENCNQYPQKRRSVFTKQEEDAIKHKHSEHKKELLEIKYTTAGTKTQQKGLG